MIVVAIVGLLMAIAIPNFIRARSESYTQAEKASQKGIVKGVPIKMDLYDGKEGGAVAYVTLQLGGNIPLWRCKIEGALTNDLLTIQNAIKSGSGIVAEYGPATPKFMTVYDPLGNPIDGTATLPANNV